jgi:hypothetical protein
MWHIFVAVQYSTVQYSTVQYSTVQYSTGEEKLSNDLLLDSFKLYVSADEKEVINACMDGHFDI